MKKISVFKQMMTRVSSALSAVLFSVALVPPHDFASLPVPEQSVATVGSAVLDEFSYSFPDTDRSSVFADRNVLVLVPHPDDDVAILGGIFEQYKSYGSTVRVLFYTSGDYEGEEYSDIRAKEAANALSIAGIPSDDIIFLGYGDQWRGTQIFHASPNHALTSHSGHKQTYGNAVKDVYRPGTVYTRNNVKNDLRSVLLEYTPDTVFCIDFDGHAEHRALSLLFEEVMGEILHENAFYTPTVLKCFCYSLSWHAVADFYQENVASTVNPHKEPYMTECNYYNWSDRLRLPLAECALSRLKANSTTYQMLKAHSSQDAYIQAGAILNGDRVFWIRNTDSLLYRASVSVSSGNASVLNDFKIINPENIKKAPCVFVDHCWSPKASDKKKEITVTFAEPADLTEICLYDNPDISANVLDAEITFSDGSVLHTGPLQKNGAETSVLFDTKHKITGFSLKLLSTEGKNAGLCELEAYASRKESDIRLIKLIDSEDNFLYDYWIDSSGECELSLYTYPFGIKTTQLSENYFITVDGADGCRASFDGDHIRVVCPKGCQMTLTITSAADSSLSDSVKINNPSSARRYFLKLLQHYEHAAGF